MNEGKRVSAAWSFAAGALLGGMAVLVPLSSMDNTAAAVEGPRLRHHERAITALPASGVSEPHAAAPARVPEKPAAAPSTNTKKASTRDHWELELQLD